MARVQFMVREWGRAGDLGLGTSWLSDKALKIAPGVPMALMHGLLETRENLEDDVQVPVVYDDLIGRLALGEAQPIEDTSVMAGLGQDEITSALTHTIWRGPVADLPAGIQAGQAIVRRCDMPVEDGLKAYLLCGILSAAPGHRIGAPLMIEGQSEMETDHIFACEGMRPVPYPERGSTAKAIYLSPVWGWGPEPMAFQSTLRLPVQDETDRIRALYSRADNTPAQLDALARRDRDNGSILRSGLTDARFQQFQQILLALDPERPASRTPIAASDLDRRNRLMGVVVKTMMETTPFYLDPDPATTQPLIERVRELAGQHGLLRTPASEQQAGPGPAGPGR